ncbi:MAG: glycoside hydrolase family 2 protein [Melioribacteraceae bacterium]|nr:glycoside hydrolase family 2 protein [Melioribacteraceae bacterium]
MKIYKVIFLGLALILNIGCENMNKQISKVEVEISDDWRFKQTNKEQWLPATVPGCVHTDLINNSLIDDPFYRTNETDLQWIEKEDWIYETTFNAHDQLLQKDKAELVFEGLDTYAEVSLNDSIILNAENMFRTWNVNVKSILKKEGNKLSVKFKNVFDISIPQMEQSPFQRKSFYNNDQAEVKVGLYNRKAQYHFGWDWGPRFVTAGIWRPIKLIGYNNYKLDGIQIVQKNVNKDLAELTAVYEVVADKEQNLEFRVKVDELNLNESVTKKVKKGFNKIELPFKIDNPKLWWSNGLGEAYLYNIVIETENESGDLERKNIRTGIRSLEVVTEKDEQGKSFYIKLNGVPVFMKGANYIPQDNFQNRVKEDHYKYIVKSAADANMNMLRVWGGGIYEEDLFYNLCDENGILVWQDFIFACAMYPGNQEFLNSVREEVIDNVRRIRNHPSLALYCGNNENEVGWYQWGWQTNLSAKQKKQYETDYDNLFHKTIPNALREFDETRYYHSSSPIAGFGGKSLAEGDSHYWGVWHGHDPFEKFEDNIARFMSEYGFQSYPEMNGIEKFTLPEDRDMKSEVMLSHQRCMQDDGKDKAYGNRLIETYMKMYFQQPKDFESYVYLSQVQQAFGIGMAFDIHRRNMPFCMGTLYWQINDCWPVASWSSIDYYGNWKALQYRAQKAFESIVIIPKPNGENLEVYIVSDKIEKVEAEIKAESFTFTGSKIKEQNFSVTVDPLTSKKMIELVNSEFLNGNEKEKTFLKLSLVKNGKVITEKLFYYVYPKEMILTKPVIEFSVKGNKLTIKSDVLAKDVFLSWLGTSRKVLSDNYFDLLPGIEKTVTIEQEGEFNNKDLKVISLWDSYN